MVIRRQPKRVVIPGDMSKPDGPIIQPPPPETPHLRPPELMRALEVKAVLDVKAEDPHHESKALGLRMASIVVAAARQDPSILDEESFALPDTGIRLDDIEAFLKMAPDPQAFDRSVAHFMGSSIQSPDDVKSGKRDLYLRTSDLLKEILYPNQ